MFTKLIYFCPGNSVNLCADIVIIRWSNSKLTILKFCNSDIA